jgi:hypothetical protein
LRRSSVGRRGKRGNVLRWGVDIGGVEQELILMKGYTAIGAGL